MSVEKNTLDPAHKIVRMLGGRRSVGRALELNSSSVSRWCTATKEGGTGGRIPQKHWRALITIASEKGLILTADVLAGLRLN